MDRLKRLEILNESSELYEKNCVGCRKWAAVANQKHHKKAQSFCEQQCQIGKRLLELGDHLSFGGPVTGSRELIKEVYQEEREKGLHDRAIRIKYNISKRDFFKRKRFWGLISGRRYDTPLIGKEKYLELKKQGYPDLWISRSVDISIDTLDKWKRLWGIKLDRYDLNRITEGPNGEEISFDNYIQYKAQGWTDYQIIKHWMIGRTTLQRKKGAWRDCGYNVDKYNSHKITSRRVGPDGN